VAPIFAGGVHDRDAVVDRRARAERFVGEYLILIGSFLTARWWTVVAAPAVILAALYLSGRYQRVFHGEVDDDNRTFPELRAKEGRSSCCRSFGPDPVLAASTRSRCSTDRAERRRA
jgi:NADH-quinone oxidoreductase subunit M